MTQAELNAIRLHFQQTGSLTKQQATDLLAETGKLINALNFACGVISDLLAEVRRLQEKLHYEETCHAEAQEEVRRLNRMVNKACRALESFDDCHSKGQGCNEKRCADCWRKYLESEVSK